PYEYHAIRYTGHEDTELRGRLEEVDDLGDLLFDPGVAGHVVERGLGFLGRVRLGARASDGHQPGHLALGPPAHPPQEADEEGGRDQPGQHRAQDVEPGPWKLVSTPFSRKRSR